MAMKLGQLTLNEISELLIEGGELVPPDCEMLSLRHMMWRRVGRHHEYWILFRNGKATRDDSDINEFSIHECHVYINGDGVLMAGWASGVPEYEGVEIDDLLVQMVDINPEFCEGWEATKIDGVDFPKAIA